MLRGLGALLVVGGTAVLGFLAAARLGSRVRTLRAVLAALALMERELSFSLTPMPELLERLADRTPPPLSALFVRCRAGLDRLGEQDLGQIWAGALEEVPLGLEREELTLLAGLGAVLGRYDGEGQRAALARVREELAPILAQAEENRLKTGRMYGVLGLTAGAFLVILLL